MFRVAVLSACLVATPACAAMDATTSWLQSQPLTRLDWVVFHAKQELETEFGAPKDDYAVGLRDGFAASLRKRDLTYVRTYASYDFDQNRFEMFVLATKPGEPSQEDCAVTLDASRNVILRTHLYSPGSSLTDDERKRAAAYTMSDLAMTPAAVGRTDAPADLSARLAALTTFRATVNKADNILDGVSCTGSLAGTDVNVRVRP